jgi:3-oxoacyl-(acyl-carrier-protein) synthase
MVTGVGPVTCLGLGLEELAEGISSLGVVRGPEWARRAGRAGGGLVPEFDLDSFVRTKVPYLDVQSRCSLAASELAFGNAGVQHDEVNPERCGLSFATVFGNMESQMRHLGLVREGTAQVSSVLFPQSLPSATSDLLAAQFLLRGYCQSFCGDPLCGAQALECAARALMSGRVDLMLAGGADVVGPELLGRLGQRFPAGAPGASQGAAFLVLETEDGLERREGSALCELSSVVATGTEGESSVDGLAEVLRATVQDALEEGGIWEGDVGVVFLCTAASVFPALAEVERKGLASFSQVPLTTAKQFVGETFAAGFPLECIAAADMLNVGVAPPKVSFRGVSKGVEFWVEGKPEPLMGDAALVAGCTPEMAAAAVLRAV